MLHALLFVTKDSILWLELQYAQAAPWPHGQQIRLAMGFPAAQSALLGKREKVPSHEIQKMLLARNVLLASSPLLLHRCSAGIVLLANTLLRALQNVPTALLDSMQHQLDHLPARIAP